MAVSRFAYVRTYESPDCVLPNTYMIIRLDGKGFHAFSTRHGFVKPNDHRALELANEAAEEVVRRLKPEVVLAYGESDEYSTLYSRRSSKLLTLITSLFTSAYVSFWPRHFDTPMLDLPIFDGRLVVYPTEREVRDYFAWRGADTHINNLYNTTFWALIHHGSHSEREAHEILKGSLAADKHEILHGRFGINYDNLPEMFRKGTTIAWAPEEEGEREGKGKKGKLVCRRLHVDVVGRSFWEEPKAKSRSKEASASASSSSASQAVARASSPSSSRAAHEAKTRPRPTSAAAPPPPPSSSAPPAAPATSSSASSSTPATSATSSTPPSTSRSPPAAPSALSSTPPSTSTSAAPSSTQPPSSTQQQADSYLDPRRTQNAAGLGWRALRA